MAGATKGRNKRKMISYRPPNLKDEKETDLLSQIEMVVKQGNVIIMADFNYPGIDRADGTAHSYKAHHFLNVLCLGGKFHLVPWRTISCVNLWMP